MPLDLPPIIQGGMGVAVSDWRLASAVARLGQLGVVSGTALDTVLVRRLQDGDPGGAMRRAMAAFPVPGVAADIVQKYFLRGGRSSRSPYVQLPLVRTQLSAERQRLLAMASFVEVFLAREGHHGPVGINLLTKIQIPTLPSLYGAMLAGVNVVIMGAGIPRDIPQALDKLTLHEPASLELEVAGAERADWPLLQFNPSDLWDNAQPPTLVRPKFLAIVSSNSLALVLARKTKGVDGFVLEGPTAGGHNAPPRGAPVYNTSGEPLYGDRDLIDLDKIKALGKPFWIAGGVGKKGSLQAAQRAGATGIQVGTLFAYARESGLDAELKQSILAAALKGEVSVRTDARASPTGYPFKIVDWPGADTTAVDSRKRNCDLGYLRSAYRKDNGGIGFRCPGEPIEAYVAKGGNVEDSEGCRCLCNALTADIGMGQIRESGVTEPPIVTSGDQLEGIGDFLGSRTSYKAADVIEYLISEA